MYESTSISIHHCKFQILAGDKLTLHSPNTIEVCCGFHELMDVTREVY